MCAPCWFCIVIAIVIVVVVIVVVVVVVSFHCCCVSLGLASGFRPMFCYLSVEGRSNIRSKQRKTLKLRLVGHAQKY